LVGTLSDGDSPGGEQHQTRSVGIEFFERRNSIKGGTKDVFNTNSSEKQKQAFAEYFRGASLLPAAKLLL